MSEHELDISQTVSLDKGKGKERDDHDLASTPDASSEHLDETVYPPVSEDAEETRRVEENLRRWEIAERQRRKAARESHSPAGPSIVSDVSRRASLLFAGRKAKQHSISSLGTHAALRSQDSIDGVPLNRVHSHSSPSPTSAEHDHDPFMNPPPPPESLSPFDDSHATRDILSPESHSMSDSAKDPTTSVDPNALRLPPPPKPLNLPPPRSPPPVASPPPPVSPLISPPQNSSKEKEPEVRWWHDWLCGCNEGPDRGGEYQAGRTNPFE